MLTIRISLDEMAPRIEITNTLNKTREYNPEGIHFAFPFNIKNGDLRYDLALAECEAEKDQLPGSNKNFITIENYVDISNDKFGITWISPDAPLVEVGEIMNDPIAYGYVDHLGPTQTFFSYLMNNYWETNFLAAQEGLFTARYIIEVHEGYDAVKTEKMALEERMPFIVKPAAIKQEMKKPGINIENPNIIVLAFRKHGDALLISLQNYSDQPQALNTTNLSSEVFATDFWGKKKEAVQGEVLLPGKGIRHFLVYNQKK
jgi:hypothetical protein